MFRNRSVDVHQFAMTPRADVPRSTFMVETMHKTTFDGGYLVPFYVDEILPGDSMSLRATCFGRLATPLFPVMDNMHVDTFFFFVPNRLVWTNWVKMMGQQTNPADSISFVIPQQVSPVGGYAVGSLQDYLGLPTVGQVAGGNTVSHSALPLRCCNLIWNEWFRDENLQNSLTVDTGDGPDTVANYVLQRRNKRFDYFTQSLPWPQKGGTAISIPLGSQAPVKTQLGDTITGVQNGLTFRVASSGALSATSQTLATGTTQAGGGETGVVQAVATPMYISNMYADLTAATAATINQLRQSFQIQRFLERDARGGTRYTEVVHAHFGVMSPDARLQRPEYLGGGSTVFGVREAPQTSGTSATGTTTPLGTLAGIGTTLAQGHGFSQSFTEHGHVIGFVNVRADLTYQQGLRRMWSRSTRYDFYWPVFSHLGERATLNKEIYADGSANDALTFGYAPIWSEYKYHPAMVTGLFRSTSAGTIDGWHLAQKFTALPTLNSTFIADTPPISRVVAVGAAANGQQIIFDSFFQVKKTRAIPLDSSPGLIDHF